MEREESGGEGREWGRGGRLKSREIEGDREEEGERMGGEGEGERERERERESEDGE